MKKFLGLFLGLIFLFQTSSQTLSAQTIKIISAIYGVGNQAKDVTAALQAKIPADATKVVLSGDNMGVDQYGSWPNKIFGDPAFGKGKALTVQYMGKDSIIRVATCGEKTPLTLEVPAPISQIRILTAIYGVGNQAKDVTAALQAKIPADATKVVLSGDNMGVDQYGSWPNKIFGDPAFGKGKTLTVQYIGKDGIARVATCGEKTPLTLEIPSAAPAPVTPAVDPAIALSVTAPADSTKSFTYDPTVLAEGTVSFNKDNWIYEEGEFLFFTPTVKTGPKSGDGQDVVVVLSATPDQKAPIYKLAIGRGNNATTSLVSTVHYENPWGGDQSIGIQSGTPYWVQLANGKLSFGTGTTGGQNVVYSWAIDPTKAFKPKYFGLGGWGSPVTVSNISVLTAAQQEELTKKELAEKEKEELEKKGKSKEQEELTELTVEAGFIAEPGKFKRIAIGLRNNELESWAIDKKGNPYRYNAYAGFPYEIPSLEEENPWEEMPLNKEIASLEDIAISQHGNIVAIDNKGEALKYNHAKNTWNILPASNKEKLARIYIADSTQIYALSDDHILYEYDMPKTGKASWVEYKVNPKGEENKCIGAAVGLDSAKKLILICISDNGKAYEASAKGMEWEELTGATNLVEVTIGNEDHIFAIDKNGLLWKLDSKDKKWEPVENKDKKQCCGFSYISANAHGDLLALDSDGDNYLKEAPAKVAEAHAKAAEITKKGAPAKPNLTRAQAVAAGKTNAKPIQHKKVVKTPTKAPKLVAKKATKKAAKKAAKEPAKKEVATAA